jgi:hypothetical protein
MMTNRRHFTRVRKTAAVFACIASLLVTLSTASAQTPTETYQRNFPNSPEALQAAVHTVQPLTRGRLPILDGFVVPQDQPLESYSRGYYECTLQVLPSGSGQSIVRAVAKITAWYTDPEASRSGYRVLPSNGRLENDALDRVDEAMADSASSASSSSSGPYSSSVKSAAGSSSSGGISPSAGNTKTLHDPVATPANTSASSDSTETIRSRREANEKKAVQLAAEEKNLEDILHNQARPTDLVIVKKALTPIFSKPVEGAQVLLSADAHDEFQILGFEGTWVHVQISGASRGWMRRSQVNLPAGYGGAVAANAEENAGAPAGASAQPFKVEKEETSAFGGKWEPLTGKSVRVVWVTPSSPAESASSATQKKSFAREMFLKAYSDQKSSTPTVAGVVVLFDSADGGQVAATMDSLQNLENGSLAGAAFWKQCSLDPPDLFGESPKPAPKSAERKN